MVLAHDVKENVRTNDVQISQNITFETMFLSSKTVKGLKKSGFYKPSPIQLHGIPLGKCGFDLLLEAKSGTGKTAVFSIIALEKIKLNIGLQVIMLAPTREIAAQISSVLKEIGTAYRDLRVEVVMGGLSLQDDIAKFNKRKVHIVVGSPGRLKHLIHDKHIDVSSVRLLVLDEADKLLEKSFLSDVKYIHSILPQLKQVILSSATYPDSCKEFIKQFVNGAQHICPENNSVLLGVTQKVTYVKYNNSIVRQTKLRYDELIKILSNIQFKQCLIFCNYQVRVKELQTMLTKADWPVEMLHGQQEQSDRLDALKMLQEYKCRILISTDLASRGIDASNIDLVINFEPPFEWQTYLHRIGRAGRFGSYGTAITILSEGNEVQKFIKLLESFNSSVSLDCLWDNNEVCNRINTNVDKTLTIEKNRITNNSNETIEITEEIHDSIKNEIYSLLFTPEKSNITIEPFEDLLTSYKNYNCTGNKVDGKYRCINFPARSAKFDESPIPIPEDDNTRDKNKAIFKVDCRGIVNINPIAKEVDTTIKETLDSDNYEIEDESNSYLAKLGLPTSFSRGTHKNRKRINKFTKKESLVNDKPVVENVSTSQQEMSNGNNSHRTWQKVKNRGNFRNSKDVSRKERNASLYNVEKKYSKNELDDSTASESYSDSSYCSSSDESIRNLVTNMQPCDFYVAWYKQLKYNAKQVEIAFRISELSSI